MRRFARPSLKLFPRDLWVGVFIGEQDADAWGYCRTVYICPVPMVVFSFDFYTAVEPADDVECHCRSYHERTGQHVEPCPMAGTSAGTSTHTEVSHGA